MALRRRATTLSRVPAHALQQVRALAEASKTNTRLIDYYYENSIELVAVKLSKTADEAEEYVLQKLCHFDGEFIEEQPNPPPPADIYRLDTVDGILRPDRNVWFVKFKIVPATAVSPEHLLVCSFHPPAHRF
jgi:hypothetical protein